MTSTRRFVRPARAVRGPKAPAVTELRLEPPTELPKPVPMSRLRMIMPVVMFAAMAGMMVLMFRGGGGMSPMSLFFPVMMVVSMFGMMGGSALGGGGAGGAAGLNEERKDYLRSITDNRKTVHQAETELHAYLRYVHPGPLEIGRLIGGKRMWEVQVGSPQFLRVRVGRGRIANQVRVIVPEAAPTSDLDPVGVVELTRFAKAYSTVGGMPVAINLLSVPEVEIDGTATALADLVRAMIAEVVVLHGPDQVAVAAVLSDPDSPEWSWLKWIPHTQHPIDTDAIGSSRMVYRTVAELRAKVLAGLNRGPFSANNEPTLDRTHYLLIVDVGGPATDRDISGIDGCTWLRLGAAEQSLPRALRFTLSGDRSLNEVTARGIRRVGVADAMSASAVRALARSLSAYRLSTVVEAVAAEQAGGGSSWEEMVGVDPGALRVERLWPRRRDNDRTRLNIPFGHDPTGGVVHLDIKESAEEGMGPHGMCIGATGSGKSEFLRTLVLSAVATHSPDTLNLLLVDFKGGATFLGFDRLSHVTAVVTNMEEEADLVTRMEDVINGEMARRQRILRDAGNFASVADYERAREQGADLPPLPTLLIVLDEFAELLEQYPSFAKLFVAIGRLGRSLRIHLLLASQKVPANRMGELEAHLSYRVALRTNQTSDSRDAIGTADAYHLPKKPGSGYLRVGSGDLQRFQAAYVGEPYIAPVQAASVTAQRVRRAGGAYRAPQLFTAARINDVRSAPVVEPVPSTPLPVPDDGEQPTIMEWVLQQLAGHGRPAHKMWLPPLNVPATLDQLSQSVTPGALRIPMAVIDKPRQQRQDVWSVDLSAAGGHVAIVGGPQSGKSTALQTLILSAALTHSTEQVQFYCLDFAGGLSALRGLPHVGSIAAAREVDRVRRTFALITNLIASRQALFAELGIDGMREFRRRRNSAAESAELIARGDAHGDVFLVVDGWDIGFAVNGPYFDEYLPVMESIAVQGLNYGVHLIIGSSRWATIRPAVKDLLQTKLELRLGDLTDTVFTGHRGVVGAIPPDRPGRCVSTEALHMLTALPRTDGVTDAESAGEGLAAAIEEINRSQPAHPVPEVKLLPAHVSLAEIRADWPDPSSLATRLVVPFGVRESDLRPAAIDFGVSTHLIVLGSSGCGKSTVLSALLESIRLQFDKDQARVLLIDYRRRHIDAIPDDQLIGYLTSERDVADALPAFAMKMRERRPPDGVTAQQLRQRSWWTGPEIFVVIDDYHMVAQRGMLNPLDALRDVVVDGRDTGLHVIVARSIAQADTAMYDNVLGQIKNLNSSGFIMDGSKLDGMLVGDVKPAKQPTGRGIFVEPLYSRRDLVQSASTLRD
ncbi:type VII secretion protein EccCa [Nocardia colli]|uniref:Type VII secretion protein EccCa n=1 Tax=Nocardia colli TaxID=2545717 RepID=A0A5N0E2E3_9NOCA|nr:type VII secretion protein EccCa [Nocardia colli]KAA8881911.1 type VII secretion protein EccCa [Nocardia colli]